MDWGVISEATFFLSVALLAVVVTIFVLSISLLGMAIESEGLEKKARQEKLNNDIKIEKGQVENKLNNDPLGNSKEIKILRSDLFKLENKLKKGETKLLNIQNKYKQAFSVYGAVAIPGICFISSIILSTVTWSVLQQNPTFNVGGFSVALLLILAWAAIIFGIYRIVESLVIIREVSMVSEQLILSRNIEAFIEADKEIKLKEKPVLSLKSEQLESPIEVSPEEEFEIAYDVHLTQGAYAEVLKISWYAPPEGFAFISQGKKFVVSSNNTFFPNYLKLEHEKDILLRHRALYGKVKIKAAKKAGIYELAYHLVCKNFSSIEKFEVQVQ